LPRIKIKSPLETAGSFNLCARQGALT